MRSVFDALVTEKSLAFMSCGSDSFDHLPPPESITESPVFKNVCARVSVKLADEIDGIVGLLGCSKRRFIEAAFLEAVDRAHAIMKEEGVFDAPWLRPLEVDLSEELR